jgi:hypothetical protein
VPYEAIIANIMGRQVVLLVLSKYWRS